MMVVVAVDVEEVKVVVADDLRQAAHGGGTVFQVPQEGTPTVSVPRMEGDSDYGYDI
jgi:hypothetical protein